MSNFFYVVGECAVENFPWGGKKAFTHKMMNLFLLFFKNWEISKNNNVN